MAAIVRERDKKLDSSLLSMTDVIVEMLKAAYEDAHWFEAHRKDIVDKYDNQFVAFGNKHIIDADSDVVTPHKRLRAKHTDMSRTLVRFVSKVPRIL